jgi:Flp pilus assembly protein TadG
MIGLARFLRDRRGAAAAEFALILPGLLFLIFGVLNLCLVVYAAVNLHSAVEGAARYATVQVNTCGTTAFASCTNATNLASSCATSGSVCYYIMHHYVGPGLGLSVSCSTADCSAAGCGHAVTASGAYNVSYGLGAVRVPLSATACFS